LPPEEKAAWESLWDRVRRLAARLEAEPRVPAAPANEVPASGSVVTGATVELRTSPFQPGDPGSVHAFTLWQVRAAGGDYASNPAYAAISDAALTRLEIPLGLLVSGTEYSWRAAYVTEDGSISEFSAETSFTTGDLPWEPRPIELAEHFNLDLVADAEDDATDSIDYGEGFLIAEGFDGTRADNPAARGLPGTRGIGVHRLGDYRGPNAIQFKRGSREAVRVEVPRGRYVAFRFLVSGGNADSTIPLDVEYADGSRERLVVRCDDWFEDIPPNAFGPLGDGVLPIWNGMDRLFAGRFEDTGQAALFEVVLPVRTDADVTALVFDPARGSYALSFTRFNLFAITGMAKR